MINTVVIEGRLAKDPECKKTPSGKDVAKLTVACQRNYKTAEGIYEADFFDIIVWNKNSYIEKFIKGAMCVVQGRLMKRIYEKDGKKVYVTEIIGTDINMFTTEKREQKKEETKSDDLLGEELADWGDENLPF